MKRPRQAHPSARGEPPEKNPEASLANTFHVARASPHGLLPASRQGGLELGWDTKQEESERQREQSGAGGWLRCRIGTAHARVLSAGRLRSTHFEMSQDLLARPNKNTSPQPRMARAGKEVSKIGSSPCLCRGRGCDSAEELFVGLRSRATRPAARRPHPQLPGINRAPSRERLGCRHYTMRLGGSAARIPSLHRPVSGQKASPCLGKPSPLQLAHAGALSGAKAAASSTAMLINA